MEKRIIIRRWPIVILIITAFLMIAPTTIPGAIPSIGITKVSDYGDVNGKVWGTVSGVNYSDYYVAVYIQVDEVWWTKPYLASPKCPIGPDGKFSCAITTGGCDLYATALSVQLMPKATDPLICFPCQSRPKNPGAAASMLKYRPYPRVVNFSGYQWRVKKAPLCKLGPGPNYFSDATNDVWVDGEGLHLRIRKGSNQWYSSEVILDQSLGYGTYIFRTNSRVDILDANMVLGMFTWDGKVYIPAHREMDIELARWGNPGDFTNAQFVLQPCSQCPGCTDHCTRFRVDLTNTNKYITYYMVWSPKKIEFSAYKGRYWYQPPETALIHKWTRTGEEVPRPGKANIRINFWLFNGAAPINGNGSEVIIEKFLFRSFGLP